MDEFRIHLNEWLNELNFRLYLMNGGQTENISVLQNNHILHQ